MSWQNRVMRNLFFADLLFTCARLDNIDYYSQEKLGSIINDLKTEKHHQIPKINSLQLAR